jgi:hypothetical protein
VAPDLRGGDPNGWSVTAPASVAKFFGRRGKHVIYFAGYGELGYQDPGCVRRISLDILRGLDTSSVLVLCGTLLRVNGHDGVADVYISAKELGFETAGVHPSVAMRFGDTHRVSPHCDHVFFVQDETWGGYLPGTGVTSPTLSLHLAVSDEMVVIGGGKHAADEMRAFAATAKTVRYFPASMNLETTREWCAKAGVELPDPRGAAHDAWAGISRHVR